MIQLDNIKQKIEELVGSSIQDISEIDEGVMNFTFNVRTSKEEYILKINPAGRENIAIKESIAIEICNTKGCKVPKIILTQEHGTVADNSFLFYKKLQGKSLNSCYESLSQSDILKISAQVANNFKCISSIKLDSAGATSDFKKFTNKSWKEFLKKECNESITFLSDNKFFSKVQIEKLRVYINTQLKNIDLSSSSFVWADFDPSNIIIDDNNNLNGFIDFEGVIGGDPIYAIGCLIAKYGYNIFTNSLIDKIECNSEQLEFYAVVRYLRLVRYSNTPLPSGKKRDDINVFLPFARRLVNNITTDMDSKGNKFRHKLAAALIITALFSISFVFFLCLFDQLYEIEPVKMGITLKTLTNIDVQSLVLLFGFLASLGSIVRVIYDFIGHTCFTEKFDFKVWWPWYWFRPLLGFTLGAIFVIFFDNSLFGNSVNDSSKFPFILSFITGFAVTDAVSFLRLISKRLFGINDKDTVKSNTEESK